VATFLISFRLGFEWRPLSLYSSNFSGVDPDGFESLVVQSKLGCKELLQIEKDAFCVSVDRLNITTIDQLRAAVAQWVKEARENPTVFRYVFFFLLFFFFFFEEKKTSMLTFFSLAFITIVRFTSMLFSSCETTAKGSRFPLLASY
jgi:hypothetical protein